MTIEIIAVKMPSRFKRGKSKKKQNEPEIVDSYSTTRRVYVQFTKHAPGDNPEKKENVTILMAGSVLAKMEDA
jgi:hypothetical protein